jgi:hypothetical protein
MSSAITISLLATPESFHRKRDNFFVTNETSINSCANKHHLSGYRKAAFAHELRQSPSNTPAVLPADEMLKVSRMAASPHPEIDDGQHSEQDAMNEVHFRLSLLDDSVSCEVGFEHASVA